MVKRPLTLALSREGRGDLCSGASEGSVCQDIQPPKNRLLSSPIPNPQSLTPKGFSLLEVLVVLTIMGVMSGLVALQLGPLLAGTRLNTGIRKVVGDLQLVRMKAIAQNRRFRVTFRPDANDYIVEKYEGDIWQRQRLHGYSTLPVADAVTPLPEGVHISAVNSSGDVIFVPRGHIDAGMTLTLGSEQTADTRRIIINLAGRVRIE